MTRSPAYASCTIDGPLKHSGHAAPRSTTLTSAQGKGSIHCRWRQAHLWKQHRPLRAPTGPVRLLCCTLAAGAGIRGWRSLVVRRLHAERGCPAGGTTVETATCEGGGTPAGWFRTTSAQAVKACTETPHRMGCLPVMQKSRWTSIMQQPQQPNSSSVVPSSDTCCPNIAGCRCRALPRHTRATDRRANQRLTLIENA